MKNLVLACVASASLTACTSTLSDPASYDEMFLSFADIDALVDAIPATSDANVDAATGDVTYSGLAYVRNYTSELDFVALGEATVDVDLDTLAVSGSASNFYEVDIAQSDLTSTDSADYVTQSVTGTLTGTATGWTGEITHADGDVVTYGMDVYNTSFFGDNLQGIVIEADGPGSSTMNPTEQTIGTFEFIGIDDTRGDLQLAQ